LKIVDCFPHSELHDPSAFAATHIQGGVLSGKRSLGPLIDLQDVVSVRYSSLRFACNIELLELSKVGINRARKEPPFDFAN
jgi:hypothetical protein